MVVREKDFREDKKDTHRAQPDPVFAQSRHHEGENTHTSDEKKKKRCRWYILHPCSTSASSFSVCVCVCVCEVTLPSRAAQSTALSIFF